MGSGVMKPKAFTARLHGRDGVSTSGTPPGKHSELVKNAPNALMSAYMIFNICMSDLLLITVPSLLISIKGQGRAKIFPDVFCFPLDK